jgi:histidinol-phosphate aminotransferase
VALADLPDSFFRSALASVRPYQPGKPVEEVQRELGLDRVVKLASNEGPYGPFPEALEAIERSLLEANRYPDGGSWRLRQALAERHGVEPAEVIVGQGADGIVGSIAFASLEPGDEIVCGWPSFASYPIDAAKQGAVARLVPLRDHTYDLEAILAQVGPRTKLVFLCLPNNPTGTTNARSELDEYFRRVPERVLTVADQAYFEYVDDPAYPDAIEEYAKRGHRLIVLRTFSKIYGLAALRVGYGVGPAAAIGAIDKVRRPFDVVSPAQEAALASLGAPEEVDRRRRENRAGRERLERILRAHGLEPVAPAVGNFLYVDLGRDSQPVFDALLRQGVIVRPLHGFGAPNAIRITVGLPDELDVLDAALGRMAAAAGPR